MTNEFLRATRTPPGKKNAGKSTLRNSRKCLKIDGGEGGIRTHGGLSTTPVFETGALNHYATSPRDPYSSKP